MGKFVVAYNDDGTAGVAVSMTGSAADVLRGDATMGAAPAPQAAPVAWADVTGKPAFGTAATTDATAYATAAQGAKADSALQNAGAFDASGSAAAAQNAAISAAAADATTKANAAQSAAIASAATDATTKANAAQSAAIAAAATDATTKANAAQSAAISAAATDATTKANAARLGTAALGYAAGAGGTVTQATNKATGVTLSKLSGEITLNAAALAAAAIVSFTLTNTNIAAGDVLILNHVTTGTRGAYGLNAQCGAGSAVIYVRNNSAGSLSEAIVIRFSLVKATTT